MKEDEQRRPQAQPEQTEPEQPGPAPGRFRLPGLPRLARVLVLGGLVVAALQLGSRLHALHWVAHQATLARDAGLPGALAGVAVILVGTLLLLPVIPLVILSGWVWGPWGALVSLPAAVLSAAVAFLAARALGQTAAAQALRRHPRVAHVVELGERGGFLTVALLRISPLVPFTPGNAALGLTRLRLGELLVGTPLGMAPGAVLYLWAGALLPDPEAIERGDALAILASHGWLWAGVVFGAAATIVLAALVARRIHASPPRAD